jgi:hypothetical protein
MRKFSIFIATLLITVVTAVGQTPAPEPDTLFDPVQQGDPAVRKLPPNVDYVKEMDRIVPEELPEAVRQTLDGTPQYKDWQKAMIYQNKSKDEYVVQFKEQDKTTTYRFDKNGRPVIDE